MDEEKNCSDVSDKRKIEDEAASPKPNTKRIKLVRPVFSPVTKSTSTTFEANKSDVILTENPKPNDFSEKVSDVVDVTQSQPPPVKPFIDSTETINQLVATPIVPEEKLDSSSDVVDVKNMFSEETKKELENLKKNIFKIEDDGSSSENDSQPKRPRLKRPTFITSATENKFECNDGKNSDITNETSKLDTMKSVCERSDTQIDKVLSKHCSAEENIDDVIEKQSAEENIDDVTEKQFISLEKIVRGVEETITENVCSSEGQLEHKNILIKNEIKEKSVMNENINKLVIGKNSEIENVNTILEDEPNEIVNSKTETEKVVEIEHVETETEQLVTKVTNVDNDEKSSDQKCIDAEKADHTKKEKILEKCVNKVSPIDEEKSYETVAENNIDNETVKENNFKIEKENEQVIEENFNDEMIKEKNIDNIVSDTVQDHDDKIILKIKLDDEKKEKIVLNIKLKNKPKDDETVVETSIDNVVNAKCSVKSNESNEIKIVTETECTSVEKTGDIVNNEATVKEHKNNIIENEKYDSDAPSQLVSSTDLKQKEVEQESQGFKSDILKAALMSKKSLESLVNSSEMHEQPGSILPTIGQEAIINKIEAEIKLTSNVDPSNNQKLKSQEIKSEINISEEASSSTCLDENITHSHQNKPAKWGSAKMNEVEKFLNDSNVTITPINKAQETPRLGKITLKLPKVGNPEIKSETTVRPDVKSELIKKITNKQIAMGDSPLKNALSQPSKSFSDYATIRPAPKPSAEQIALLEQQILSTPKKRGRPSKALAQQKQLLLQYQQLQQQQNIQEGNTEDEAVFHVPLFDMEDMSGGAGMFESFDASTPKRGKSLRGKGSRGRRGRGGKVRGREGSDSDTTSATLLVDNEEGEITYEEMNQEEETKQVAMMEAERLRKEEERERKLEARKKKLKERNDLLKEKKLKKKQKAEERRLQWHEKKRLMQEEKARAAEMKKSLPPPQNFDDETRMSADCNNSRSQTPARNFMMGEDDLSISGTTNDSIRMKKGRMEVIDLESNKTLTVDQIAEYQWPLEGGELYMIQEQISNFLGVKSFKRKYPGLKRRNVEAEERTFLCDSGLVAESLCDLGLTVIYSAEVLDVMYVDFPEKYEELREYMRLKHAKELSNRQRALMTISSNTDGSKLDLRDRAMEAVANWNANLNKSRLESRKCSMDMQTFIVHYPKSKCKKMAISRPKIGSYPLALLPGQFCDYYATYSSEDLRYLPMNTVMYGPLKSVDKDFPVSLSSQSESEDSSSDDSSDSDDSVEVDNKLGKNGLEYGPCDKKGAECKLCLGTAEKNKKGTVEPLINCSKCLTIYHPTCLDMTLEMVPYIKRYNWQCNECKSCAQCKEVADEDKMLFCDLCDRGYHIYCVGLRKVPEGRWHCQECAMCSSCSVTDPGPGDSKWFYEFKKVEKTGSKVYSRTLCAPCSRLWKKGHYCPNCMRCYPIKNVERMIQCNSCDRYIHSECVNENASNRQVVACAVCEEKAVSRLLTTVPRSLIKV